MAKADSVTKTCATDAAAYAALAAVAAARGERFYAENDAACWAKRAAEVASCG